MSDLTQARGSHVSVDEGYEVMTAIHSLDLQNALREWERPLAVCAARDDTARQLRGYTFARCGMCMVRHLHAPPAFKNSLIGSG